MDDLRFNTAEMDNDGDVEIEEYEEILDRITYRTPFQSRSASPEMVSRSTFHTRSASQEPHSRSQ